MKKLIPRNTTIPVRRSDVFSTGADNQTVVEVHVVQGEREMAADNKSLGRFKLTGIPPAPRGYAQVQVAFDIDANGILQVTALDKTTGREQSLIIQGASTLDEAEVKQMLAEAEHFADEDRQRRDRVAKRAKAETLITRSERRLREVALDYGMYFASNIRNQIELAIRELRDSLKRGDERAIDLAQADLEDILYELNREVNLYMAEEEAEDDLLEPIRRTLTTVRDTLTGDDRSRRSRSSVSDRSDRSERRSGPVYNYDDDWDDDEW
jgi:molecular chaperone DnaK